MNDEIKFDLLLDVKGLGCPLPILKTKKALESLDRDQILKVETTDPASKKDLASWARRTGNVLLRIDEHSGTFTFYIQKKRREDRKAVLSLGE